MRRPPSYRSRPNFASSCTRSHSTTYGATSPYSVRLRVLTEIDLRRRLHAVRPRAQVDLVQVQLEDRVFGEVALDLHRDARFLELARERLLAADLLGEDVAGQLHRDGREALRETERK